MKQVRLSRAFGTTPGTVYKRMENTLHTAPQAAPCAASSKETRAPAAAAPAGSRHVLLIVLSSLLLLVTAALSLCDSQLGVRQWFSRLLSGNSAGMLQVAADTITIEDLTFTVRSASADSTSLRVTASFAPAQDASCRLASFWYDRKTLPETLPANDAAAGEVIYHIFCDLAWENADGTLQCSELNIAQQNTNGSLSVLMTGTWQMEDTRQTVVCRATIIRTGADGSYGPEDIFSAELPFVISFGK